LTPGKKIFRKQIMNNVAFSEKDYGFMRQALKLADAAKGSTFPNPAVGAVIVKNDMVIACGATHEYGGLHAEAAALESAGNKARGASIYVTLEPCAHFGKTPPCTDAIIKSGIKKVFISCMDQNPVVKGKGINVLKKNGIQVYNGLLEKEAARINEDFFYSISEKKPWITLKLAMTLDGRIADAEGNSKWITNAAARTFVHELRRKHAGIAVGRKTLVADNPRLTVRHVPGFSPVRFVFSSTPELPEGTYFAKTAKKTKSVIVCSSGDPGKKKKLTDAVEIWFTGKTNFSANLKVFCRMAYEENLTSILFEGGSMLASSLLEAGMVNRLYLFYGNKIIGGGLSGLTFNREYPLKSAISLMNIEIMEYGDNHAVTGLLKRRA
jgi:diaminohydroxyphosphoribosylaminopyrimidine deaminase/5-amino-6-(5-phosphoribosylamino)uracil reductase